jgi:hypothetical protein
MNSVQSKTITKEEKQIRTDNLIRDTLTTIGSNEWTLDSFLVFIQTTCKRIHTLKRKVVLTEDSFVHECVSTGCFEILRANADVLKKNRVNISQPYKLTVKELSKYPYYKINDEEIWGIQPHHIVELRTLVNAVGLSFRDTYKNY